VLDLGCWPGGWLQVAAQAVGPKGYVVGVDRAAIDPPLDLANVATIEGDLADPSVSEQLKELLGGLADVLLSDAAPKLTGIRDRDRALEEEVLLGVEALLEPLLRPKGDLLLKLLEGPEAQESVRRIRQRFASAKSVKVSATRKGSSERYLLARGFQG
jgi:23S rRNA (uridine2552-2'-O)-methyltransferase